MKNLTFPTILTLIRLVLSPLILPILFVYLLPLNIFWINTTLAGIFLIFGLTDFFDGYFARKFNQETRLGKILDPIADKFLIYSTLVALLAAQKIYFYWVIILVGREFFMMGLRHIGLEHGINVHVSLWGKLKTTLQIALLTVIIANPYQHVGWCQAPVWHTLELGLLVVTLLLTVWSAYRYYVPFMREFEKTEERP